MRAEIGRMPRGSRVTVVFTVLYSVLIWPCQSAVIPLQANPTPSLRLGHAQTRGVSLSLKKVHAMHLRGGVSNMPMSPTQSWFSRADSDVSLPPPSLPLGSLLSILRCLSFRPCLETVAVWDTLSQLEHQLQFIEGESNTARLLLHFLTTTFLQPLQPGAVGACR
jgi:hypothetical protein